MKLEKATLFSLLGIFGGFVIREFVKARVRLKTMAIPLSTLQTFRDDDTFVALYFNPFYDNKTLVPDVVSLNAYSETAEMYSKKMQKVPLETAGEDKVFGNEKDYSAYKLRKEDIQVILDRFSGDPTIQYVLFVPELYREDKNYFSYKIISANAMKQPSSLANPMALQTQSVATVEEGNAGGGEVRTQMFAMTSESFGAMYLNPSPPASSSFQVS